MTVVRDCAKTRKGSFALDHGNLFVCDRWKVMFLVKVYTLITAMFAYLVRIAQAIVAENWVGPTAIKIVGVGHPGFSVLNVP